jgi:two-component system chemotaxis sensor kinase CheA
MTLLERFTKIVAYLPLIDKNDRSALPAIISELEEIMLDESVPEALLLQVTRCCKLAEHIALNETDFEKGINKLSQNINRLLLFVEKTEQDKIKTATPPEVADINTEVPSDPICEDIVQYRIKFASAQKSTLDDFESSVLAFEKGDTHAIAKAKRILHTWKGEFGVLELPQYSSLLHQVEQFLEEGLIGADQLFYFKDFLTNQLPLIASGDIPDKLSIDVKKLFPSLTERRNKDAVKPFVPAIQPRIPQFKDIDNSLLSDFIIESRDHIHTAESLLLELESDSGNPENINSIFRCCHTIKGVAGFINLHDLCDFAHTMESLLDNSRKGDLKLTSMHIDLLLISMDCLKESIMIIEECMLDKPYRLPDAYEQTINALKYTIQNKGQLPDSCYNVQNTSGSSLQIQKTVLDTTLAEASDASLSIDANDDSLVIPVSLEQPVQVVHSKASNLEETIRVPIQRLDQLIDAIGEAVIAQSMISADQTIRESNNQNLHTKIAQTTMIMRQIQELSMSLRMVSLKSTFQKMARLVRDLSKKSSKEVHFITDGEDTELDKSVVENIGDPLIHMIRNSVDHGLETSEERIAKGKPSAGTINLRAYHKAGNVYIEIRDDGKGLDKELIFNKAVSKGLCKSEDKLTDSEIYHFIFLPGFSTAKVVTDLSGRGVGMDVVKRNIEALRGSVDIFTEKDKGTTFTIRLPLTLAIIDGMIVRVDTSNYIVPTLSIIETLAATSDHVIHVLDKGNVIKVRDNLIPLVYLSDIFNNVKAELNGITKIALIVEDMMGRRSALIVDEIIGQQQVVIKNLGSGLGDISGISGGAIMSDGTVSLIIDVGGILKTTLT